MKISLPVTHKFDCSLLQSWSVWLTWLLTAVIDLRKAIILVFYSIRLYFHHQSHPQLSIIYALVQPLYLEKAMAPHSSTLAWKIPWTEEPGRLQSMGLLRVRHDWATSLSLFSFMYWRRKWQPTPVFLPGESQGRGSLVGCRLWGRTQSGMTEVT